MTIDNLINWLQEAEDNNTWLVSTQSVKRHLEKIKQTKQLTIPVVSKIVACGNCDNGESEMYCQKCYDIAYESIGY